MKFMQSNWVNALGSLGGLVAFILAFGWLLLPTVQIQLVDFEAISHFSSVLESGAMLGMSPWLMLALAGLALSAIYAIVFNFNVSQVLLAVIATAMMLLVINTLNFIGAIIALIILCSLMALGLKRQSN